jgi:hypothetical protein
MRIPSLAGASLGLVIAAVGCSSPAVDRKTDPPESSGACDSTRYAGDSACLAAPASSKGFQLHYGPVDHDDPDEVAKYLLQPGAEIVNCYAEKTGNTADVLSVGYQFHMRPGSHHLIAQTQATSIPDGFLPCGSVVVSPGGLGGTQLQIDDHVTDPASENQGLAIRVPKDTQSVLNFHVINTTNTPILTEAWLNYYYAEPSEVKGYRGSVFLVGGLGFRIEPGTHQTYQYSCSPQKASRILSLAAHMHTHAARMTAWKVTNGAKTKVMEAFDWEEPATLYFDSAHVNTPSNAATKTAGGDYTGDLTIQPSDVLQWECDIDNTSAETLTFRNEVKTGEMCVVTGSMVNAVDPNEPTDFTCVRN